MTWSSRVTYGLAVAGVILVASVACSTPSSPASTETPTSQPQTSEFSLTSSAFRSGEAIPAQYTCDGQSVSPALSWSGVPQNTRAFALVVDDPDAPSGTFTHWVAFNIPADARGLPENVAKTDRMDNGGIQGRNSSGRLGFTGPCPPPGNPHHYHFMLYALDAPLNLQPGATKQDVLKAAEGHILAQAELVGTYHR